MIMTVADADYLTQKTLVKFEANEEVTKKLQFFKAASKTVLIPIDLIYS